MSSCLSSSSSHSGLSHPKAFKRFIFAQISTTPTRTFSMANLRQSFTSGKHASHQFSRFSQSMVISLRLGSQILVVASTSSAAVEILKTHDRVLSGRYVPHAVPAKNSEKCGWAVECNDAWKNLRTVCRLNFSQPK
ncbi:(S)-N-methylcoclaurine 3'-hydroxylase isozyme 1 [Vitis vinifera]|uniref:(S)-N-methylcoclaurine 3'-hydroxylase isozyme 1 n=1 Tax=Vitis vinifera TaxID=29760 RepID=A0A438BZE7_VITVI|nr:(S)-N-methylcoclaurine 3'-hydroxylase isozyme 1 [Vitis vinifera]